MTVNKIRKTEANEITQFSYYGEFLLLSISKYIILHNRICIMRTQKFPCVCTTCRDKQRAVLYTFLNLPIYSKINKKV